MSDYAQGGYISSPDNDDDGLAPSTPCGCDNAISRAEARTIARQLLDRINTDRIN